MGGGNWLKVEMTDIFKVMEMFQILIGVLVTQMYIFVKTQQIAQLGAVCPTICKS